MLAQELVKCVVVFVVRTQAPYLVFQRCTFTIYGVHSKQYTALSKRSTYMHNTIFFQVLSRSPESGSTNSIITIRTHTVYQHFLEYEDPIRNVRRVIGDRVQPFGSSLNLSCFPRRAGRSITSSGSQVW